MTSGLVSGYRHHGTAKADADPFNSADPGERDDLSAEGHAYRRLWASVLLVGVTDALTSAAEGWPLPWVGTSDFHQVAALAGFDGTALSDAITRMAADPERLAQARANLPGTPGARRRGNVRAA